MKKPATKKEKPTVPGRGRRPLRRGRGVLALIGTLLVGSAALRVAVGASGAFAADDPAAQLAVTQAEATAQTAAVPEAGVGETCVAEEDIRPMIDALKQREARVSSQEEEIRIRMQALAVAESEIDRKLVRLEEAEASLRATLANARTAAEEDVARLTDVYANMKPKQAAALFETMDPEFAAGFLGRMAPDAAAAIMAGLSPETAYTISVIVAGRNANAPRE